MNKITMLGTGNATVTHIYNTCFTLQTSTTLLLVDAGGGNGILTQLRKADIQIADIHHLFVTHSHTDHVLGVIWSSAWWRNVRATRASCMSMATTR